MTEDLGNISSVEADPWLTQAREAERKKSAR